ncbi:GreA/GreB family elongation factor [Candidatus Dojkabacteria bacterium]|nr:GreA/GreB family elongation factor [Candidatus Dojkabacteria bacterium]
MSKTADKRIKDLELKLSNIREKYNQLTKQLEDERGNYSSESGALDYQQLVEERRVIEKYMERLQRKLAENHKNTGETIIGNKAQPGNNILIKNSKTEVRFRLVEEIYSQEERQISINSPVGKAVQGKRVGEEIRVETPKGKIHYRIEEIG